MFGRSSDPLSEILQDLRLSGASYGRCELTAPWGIDFPAQSEARFHFVARGNCWMRVGARRAILLRGGDVALLPRGTHHTLGYSATARTKSLDSLPLKEIGDRTYLLKTGGGGAQTLLMCCSVRFEEPAVHPLLELMPPLLMVRSGAIKDAALPALLDIMASEVSAQRVGTATIMTRLADVVISRLIRLWAESRNRGATGWLAAIRDPTIGKALSAIHSRPGHPWSVEALADVAKMSRSMFSVRFTSVVGSSPGRYLARWRMHLASTWLRRDRLTVAEVAARLGYESEASFSRAFKRFMNVPPSALRRAPQK